MKKSSKETKDIKKNPLTMIRIVVTRFSGMVNCLGGLS